MCRKTVERNIFLQATKKRALKRHEEVSILLACCLFEYLRNAISFPARVGNVALLLKAKVPFVNRVLAYRAMKLYYGWDKE